MPYCLIMDIEYAPLRCMARRHRVVSYGYLGHEASRSILLESEGVIKAQENNGFSGAQVEVLHLKKPIVSNGDLDNDSSPPTLSYKEAKAP